MTPQLVSPEEKYQKHVRWMIGQDKFTSEPGVEETTKYAGQRPGGCAYCFTDDHQWSDCARINGAKRSYLKAHPVTPTQPTEHQQPPASNPTPARRVGITEEITTPIVNETPTDNSINAPVVDYFCISTLSNVVARVIKTIPCSPLLSESLRMIIDSGTTHHMSGNKSLFVTYTPLIATKFVLLGDGVTTIPISGTGTIDYSGCYL